MASNSRARCPYEGCGKSFFNKYNVKRHYDRKHLNYLPFVCSLCAKVLSSKQTLDEHMNSHTGEEPYECSFPGCFKRFKQASTLSVHKKTHRRSQAAERASFSEALPYWVPQNSNREQIKKLLTVPKITGPQTVVLPSIFDLVHP